MSYTNKMIAWWGFAVVVFILIIWAFIAFRNKPEPTEATFIIGDASPYDPSLPSSVGVTSVEDVLQFNPEMGK